MKNDQEIQMNIRNKYIKEIKDADEKIIFFIRDNGMGIAPQFHEHIFGLFNKLDARSEGTGVGLALVKRIIEFHGGRIWVESDGKNGSTFYLALQPAAAHENQRKETSI